MRSARRCGASADRAAVYRTEKTKRQELSGVTSEVLVFFCLWVSFEGAVEGSPNNRKHHIEGWMFCTAECLQTPLKREGKTLPYRSVGEMSPFRTFRKPSQSASLTALPKGEPTNEGENTAPPNIRKRRSNGRFVNRPCGTRGNRRGCRFLQFSVCRIDFAVSSAGGRISGLLA